MASLTNATGAQKLLLSPSSGGSGRRCALEDGRTGKAGTASWSASQASALDGRTGKRAASLLARE